MPCPQYAFTTLILQSATRYTVGQGSKSLYSQLQPEPSWAEVLYAAHQIGKYKPRRTVHCRLLQLQADLRAKVCAVLTACGLCAKQDTEHYRAAAQGLLVLEQMLAHWSALSNKGKALTRSSVPAG